MSADLMDTEEPSAALRVKSAASARYQNVLLATALPSPP